MSHSDIKSTPLYDSSNVFSRILRGELTTQKIYEDNYVVAFPDRTPRAPLHLLVIPKGSYIDAQHFHETATDAEIVGFYKAISHLCRDVAKTLEAGYRLQVNCGPKAGQEVFHYHVHILSTKALEESSA